MAGVIDASGTVPDGSTARWKDRKRYLWLIGLVVPVPGLRRLRAAWPLTGWGVWFWIGPIVVLGVVPGRRPRGRAWTAPTRRTT